MLESKKDKMVFMLSNLSSSIYIRVKWDDWL